MVLIKLFSRTLIYGKLPQNEAMKKGLKITFGISLIIFGWYCIGMALMNPLGGHPYNTIVLLLGPLIFAGGIVILAIPSKSIREATQHSLQVSSLPYPVKQEILVEGNRIVLLKLPAKIIFNRNVYSLDETGKILWQIKELPSYPSPSKECHYNKIEFRDGNLTLWNWCDLKVVVNPKTGEVLETKEFR